MTEKMTTPKLTPIITDIRLRLLRDLYDRSEIRGQFVFGRFRSRRHLFQRITVDYLCDAGLIERVSRSEFDYYLRFTESGRALAAERFGKE